MGAVVFNYTEWSARYPEFSSKVDSTSAALFFAEATLYLDNGDSSLVPYDPPTTLTRKPLLYMLTAHIAFLAVGDNLNPAPPMVGRVSEAAQGTVRVATDMPDVPGSAAWFAQTKYGFNYWQASAAYRMARYRAPIPAVRYPRPYRW